MTSAKTSAAISHEGGFFVLISTVPGTAVTQVCKDWCLAPDKWHQIKDKGGCHERITRED
ncbi:hypothetical protein M1K46_14625 [Fictibacillus sp. WQ 8-8]|uniref:hypothetical protein n=1 Tax=Fictibacillus sp. WQ 8-8 TaxID=2938788 RepID=UPI00210E63F0|nr:hypothetical protein [Fictibacillus sp. WQ 8-8]MCQ6266887.1 hypothetical protein [Fictibacillus sp. WQ 8-8]